MRQGATFSECRKFRYALWRIWDDSLSQAMFIGLNPSTADETRNDPTLNRCIQFARSWGYGGVYMTNLFAYCATDPSRLVLAGDPVGKINDRWILKLSRSAGLVIAAWGNLGVYRGRCDQIIGLIPELYCLKINRSGQPAHPLYLKANLRPRKLAGNQEPVK